jgi:hypothetical protein
MMPDLTNEHLQRLLDLDAQCMLDGSGTITALVREVQRLRNYSNDQHTEKVKFEARCRDLEIERERLRLRILSAAGDDLCRLTQEEIKELSAGTVKIPPEEEFLASCKNFHSQIASESGVLSGCLTLAQMIAENERLLERDQQSSQIIAGLTEGQSVNRAFIAELEAERDAIRADWGASCKALDDNWVSHRELIGARKELYALKQQLADNETRLLDRWNADLTAAEKERAAVRAILINANPLIFGTAGTIDHSLPLEDVADRVAQRIEHLRAMHGEALEFAAASEQRRRELVEALRPFAEINCPRAREVLAKEEGRNNG